MKEYLKINSLPRAKSDNTDILNIMLSYLHRKQMNYTQILRFHCLMIHKKVYFLKLSFVKQYLS